MTELKQGSPFNVVVDLTRDYDLYHITGINLAALMNAIMERDDEGVILEALCETVLEESKNTMLDVRKLLAESGGDDVVLARVDDRLIHGEVVTAWIPNSKATRLIKNGVPLKEVNLGGAGIRGERQPFINNVALNPEEVTACEEMKNGGCRVYYQLVPEQGVIGFITALIYIQVADNQGVAAPAAAGGASALVGSAEYDPGEN